MPASARQPAKRKGLPGGVGRKRKGLKKATTTRPSTTSTDPARDCVQHGYIAAGPIAAGAFSTIRHARVESGHPRLRAGLEVAIKTWGVAACKRDAGNAFNRDTELATLRRAALRPHPHIANLLDVLCGPVYTHAVLEYCSGGSLLRHLQRLQTSKGGIRPGGLVPNALPSALSGAMDARHARTLVRQVLSALAFLHGMDVAHRDVKPANVLFTDASRTSIKLCDFGFAVVCPRGHKLRMRCGTPMYNAPELVRGVEYLGPPVDMWAVGAMLYEMLHGRPAFHGNTLPQIEQRIRTAQHQPLSLEVPADGRSLVSACLVASPNLRISASTALSTHPWLAIGTPPTPPTSASAAVAAAAPSAVGANDPNSPLEASLAAASLTAAPATTSTLTRSSLAEPEGNVTRTESGGSSGTTVTDAEAEPALQSAAAAAVTTLPPFLSKHPELALQVYHSRVGTRSKLEPSVAPTPAQAKPTPGRTVV